jgi:hypothetical protein
LLTLGTVTATAVTCIVLATRRVSAACESAQYALSVVGACIAAGCAVAFISAPLWISALSRGHVGALLSLRVMAVVGWLLMLDVRMSARVRGGGLIAVGLWLAVAPLAASRADAEFAGRASAAPGDREIAGAAPGPNDRAIRAGRTLLAACGLHIAAIGDLGVPTPGDVEWVDGWQADLAPVGPDLAIIDRPLALVTGNASPAARRRLLTRCAGILHRHGRVAIEDPDEAWGRHALAELVAANPRAESSAYLLRASTGEGDYTALLLGSDVPAWIAEARRRADVPAGLYRVESPEALRDLLSSH